MTTERFQRLDLVEFPQGDRMIVTDYKPSRPVNCYVGVKENGKGAAYKFGPKHRARKVGTVSEDHPALRANAARNGARNGLDAGARATLEQLLNAVESGDLDTAQSLAPAVRVLV